MILGKIIPRLMLGFLLLSPLPLAGLTWLYVQAFEHILRQSELENLSSLADKKADQINTYINERLNDGRVLAKSPVVLDILQAHLIQRMASPHKQAEEQSYRDYFRSLFESVGYYDLLLIDTAGNVVFSILHESDFGSNLNTGPYRETALADAHREAIALLDMQITQAQSYAPSGGKPAIFIVAPMFKAGKVIGTLALQMDLDKITAVTNDTIGLGKTGKTILAQLDGDQALYIDAMQHSSDSAYPRHIPLDKLIRPMRSALAGEHDKGISRDYAGVEIVCAWRYLPALRWGMMVKMDTSEAFAPLYLLQKLSLIALGLLLLIASVVALLFGRALATPIRQFSVHDKN